jgi:hypothetical protein
MIGKLCVIRTYSAGVHIGTLAKQDGKEVTLTDARRLWRWRGANTLSEVSARGVALDYTRLSEPVPEILLTEVIEVIPVTAAGDALASLTTSRWGA